MATPAPSSATALPPQEPGSQSYTLASLVPPADLRRPRNNLGLFWTILGVLGVPLVFALQANDVVHIRWLPSLFIYVLCICLFAWAYIKCINPPRWTRATRYGVLVACLIALGLISGTGAWKQYQTDMWSGIKRREFIFKYSRSWTDARREIIITEISRFAAYLESTGLELPSGTPTVEIVTTQGGGAATSGEGRPTYYDDIQIEAKRLDDPKAATEAYSAWVLSKLLKAYAIPSNPTNLISEIEKDLVYRWGWIMIFHPYFSDSYWGQQREFTKTMAASNALWKIRSECKPTPEFADKLVAFTVRAFIDDTSRNYPNTREEYLFDRIRIADRIIDSESSQMPIIERVLREYGIPSTQATPPTR